METMNKKRKYRKLISSAHSLKNRHHFIQRCLEEKVIPKSLHKVFKTTTHIFPVYVQEYLESIAEDLKQESTQKFENARLLGTELRQKQLFSTQDYKNLQRKMNIQNNKQRRNLEQKLGSLISSSGWKNIGRKDLVNNLSSRNLNDIEEESLSFGPKFAIGLHKSNISDSITKN